jgi:hypothetical protein
MREAVGAEFEQRVGHQLRGAGRVRSHPAAAHEQRRLHLLASEDVDDRAVVTSKLLRLLAEIQRQGDQLAAAGRQVDTADRAAQRSANGRQERGRSSHPEHCRTSQAHRLAFTRVRGEGRLWEACGLQIGTRFRRRRSSDHQFRDNKQTQGAMVHARDLGRQFRSL